MTPLKKPVGRRSEELYRDRSQYRRIVATLYPAGFIGLRLEKCRREETLSMPAAYETAVQTRLMREHVQPVAPALPCQVRPAVRAARVRGAPKAG